MEPFFIGNWFDISRAPILTKIWSRWNEFTGVFCCFFLATLAKVDHWTQHLLSRYQLCDAECLFVCGNQCPSTFSHLHSALKTESARFDDTVANVKPTL